MTARWQADFPAGVMLLDICQAFGIPAIGVGQPAHVCVADKAANPLAEPQPGSAWKVGYGRGWEVSKLEGLAGPEHWAKSVVPFLASLGPRHNGQSLAVPGGQ